MTSTILWCVWNEGEVGEESQALLIGCMKYCFTVYGLELWIDGDTFFFDSKYKYSNLLTAMSQLIVCLPSTTHTV